MSRPDITTLYEVNALKKLRAAPNATYELTPSGEEFSRIKYEIQCWQEKRIDYLQTRLQAQSHGLRRDFDRER